MTMVMTMMVMNTMQANKRKNSIVSASVQLQATARTMHSASLFQQKVFNIDYKTWKIPEKNPEFLNKGQKIPTFRNCNIGLELQSVHTNDFAVDQFAFYRGLVGHEITIYCGRT